MKKLEEASPLVTAVKDVTAGVGKMPGVGLASPQGTPVQGGGPALPFQSPNHRGFRGYQVISRTWVEPVRGTSET